MTEQDIKHHLQQTYNLISWREVLRNTFPRVDFFNQPENPFEGNEKVVEGKQVGTVQLDDDKSLAVFDIHVNDSIKILRNRRDLREIAAKCIDGGRFHGALAFFHNPNQPDYRFSFISKEAKLDPGTGELILEETLPKRFTYIFGPSQACTTPAIQIKQLGEKKQNGNADILALKEAFSLEALNKEFYSDYQRVSKGIIKFISKGFFYNKLKAHQGALNLLNRIMFVYFIQKKDWLMQNPRFLYSFWNDYKNHTKKQDTFHEKWLNQIFFSAFNGQAYQNPGLLKTLPKKYHEAVIQFPYLNGGLFTFDEEYDNFILPDSYFEEIFEFLERYNFTINEDAEDEVNLEINPELLGKMYEGMINATDLDDVDAEHGIIYTERPEINFMTRRSFVEVLDKKLKGEYSREFLYHFCFGKPEEKSELLKTYKADIKELRDAVLSITACDPACGSGSMLIGVIQLQVELLRSIDVYDGKPHTAREDFLLKKKIISESIYGVDIKEWAVRIAELRFWLYMIAEAEFTTSELTEAPLLPNLDFKLRKGNSLIQQIGSIEFSLEGLFKKKDGTQRRKSAGAARKLNEFIKKKKAFITNQTDGNTTFKKLKAEELYVFKEFLQELVWDNNKQIKNMEKGDGQIALFDDGISKNLFEQQISELREENEQLEKTLALIRRTKQLPFSFDIDFMEIFLTKEDPGFDLVIGNPPYVRQEDILPAEDAMELERLLKPENKEEKAKISREYKETLSKKVFQTYPFLASKISTEIDGKKKTINVYGNKVPGRSDLYIYFQLLCPALLNSKGTFCFIISNSWLDVEFGGFVQQFLLKHTHLFAVYDCSVRSFDASVNTIIYLHSAVSNIPALKSGGNFRKVEPVNNNVHFVMNNANYSHTSYAPLLIEQEHCRENTFRRFYHLIVKNQQELWEEAFDEDEVKYYSNKWGGKYLRAPEIYFKILQKGVNKIQSLNSIATVVPGCYAGISDFFYVNEKIINKYEIESQYLIPLLRNSDCINKLNFSGTGWYVIGCQDPRHRIKPGLLKYIKWGEAQVTRKRQKTAEGIPYPETESVKNRKPGWWAIPEQNLQPTNLFMQYVGNARFYCPTSNSNHTSDRSFHRIFSNNENLKYFLNSSLVWLFVMLMGRSNLGQGALKFEKSDALRLPVLIPRQQINHSMLFDRAPLDVFSEMGFDLNLPIRQQEPNPLPDRQELDKIIFDELGLTLEERKEVYWATAELVKQRLEKAGSR